MFILHPAVSTDNNTPAPMEVDDSAGASKKVRSCLYDSQNIPFF